MRASSAALLATLALGCSPVRPPDMASSTGTCAGAAICDDFETYPVGHPPAGPWALVASAGETATVDSGKSWSGSRSLLVKHSGTAHNSVYITLGAPALPLPGNDLHGRLMLFITRAPPRLHWDNVRASGRLPDGREAQYNLGGEKESFLSNYEPHDCYRRTQTPYPQGRWACLQWRFDGAHNGFHVWLDGKAVDEATVRRFGQGCVDKTTSEWVAPTFERVLIGWEQYRGADPIDMWVDDVAIGKVPVACPHR